MTTKAKKKEKLRSHFYYQIDERLFTLDVKITDGPMTDNFIKANRKIIRRIEARGDTTLAELHEAIFEAFDRDDPHMFEFRLNDKSSMDPDGKRYIIEEFRDDDWSPETVAGVVETTIIGSLGLSLKDRFSYWFDFGDDWWHEIKVVSIGDKAPEPEKTYPKIISRTGESPPQYPDWDEVE
jgi:hypothetical protein